MTTPPDLQTLALNRLAQELQLIATDSELSIAEFCVALRQVAKSDALLRGMLKRSTFSTDLPTQDVPTVPPLVPTQSVP